MALDLGAAAASVESAAPAVGELAIAVPGAWPASWLGVGPAVSASDAEELLVPLSVPSLSGPLPGGGVAGASGVLASVLAASAVLCCE